MFLPANTTSVIQPMDQNPINMTQLKCKKLLLAKIVAQENERIDDLLKKITIKDAIIHLNEAWNTLGNSILIKAWKPLFNWGDDDFDEDDLLPLSKIRNEIYVEKLKEVQVVLNRISGSSVEISIEEVKEWNETEFFDDESISSESSNDESDDCEMDLPKVSNQDAMQHINCLLKWCDENGQNASFISSLNSIREKIVDVMLKKEKKQTKMTSFLNKS